jgi:putative membrane protein
MASQPGRRGGGDESQLRVGHLERVATALDGRMNDFRQTPRTNPMNGDDGIRGKGRISMPHRLPVPFFTARYAYPTTLLCAFCFVWLALAIAPSYRQDWLLENVVVFAAVPLFVATITRLRFSNMAYTLLFVFLCAHEIGAHYTYSLVPYDEGFRHLTGRSLDALLGFRRNHYDRLVHFLYGLLLLPITRELFEAKAPLRGVLAFLTPIFFIEATSAIFELVEWLAAVVFGGELGQAYLGTQGDVWDAQCDMALALAGAVLTQSALTFRRRRSRP